MTSKIAAGLIIYRNVANKIQYLLLQTSYGKHHWTPPKGHVDPGESELDTAFRETVEESGIPSSELKIFEDSKMTIEYPVNGVPKTVIYWIAELKNPEYSIKLSNEHQDYKWLEIEEACKYCVFENMQKIMRLSHNFITLNNKQ